jgi:hypothetical protein
MLAGARKTAPAPAALARVDLAGEAPATGATLFRRRTVADGKDAGLWERRRGFDRAGLAEGERGVELQPPIRTAESPAPSPTAANLAAAVERLALALARRDRLEGPALEMQFGASLRIRLTSSQRGLELSLAVDRAVAGLARAELPALLRTLRDRGIAVARAEVRLAPGGAAERRVDGQGGLR